MIGILIYMLPKLELVLIAKLTLIMFNTANIHIVLSVAKVSASFVYQSV